MSQTYGLPMSARLFALFAALAFALLSVAGPGAQAAMTASQAAHADEHAPQHGPRATAGAALSGLCTEGTPCGAPDAAGCERLCAGLVALPPTLPAPAPPAQRAAMPRPGPKTSLVGAAPPPADRPPIG